MEKVFKYPQNESFHVLYYGHWSQSKLDIQRTICFEGTKCRPPYHDAHDPRYRALTRSLQKLRRRKRVVKRSYQNFHYSQRNNLCLRIIWFCFCVWCIFSFYLDNKQSSAGNSIVWYLIYHCHKLRCPKKITEGFSSSGFHC